MLLKNVKFFNILGLANLNNDIIAITKLCNEKFKNHHSKIIHYLKKKELMDCLKEIREFLELFLADHPDSFLDPKKR
jgi:hypothetical protein